jgi:hypothetical protein
MKRVAVAVSFALGLGALAVGEYPNGLVTPVRAADADAHAYFNALVANAAHYKSYSLRSQQQLETYKDCGSCEAMVTYGPQTDTFTKPQDAAKVLVPAWRLGHALAASVGPDDTTLTLTSKSTSYIVGASLKIDSEVVRISSIDGLILKVERGAFGTSRQSHAAGTRNYINNLSLNNQVWLPMGTSDGHSFITTWDAWYPRELAREYSGLSTWKTYQFRRQTSGGQAIWFEVRTRFDQGGSGDVGGVDIRGYGGLGPNVTNDQPLSPQAGTFMIKPETWTRYWMMVEQRANAYDLMHVWVADENRGPVKIIDRLEMEVGSTIQSFQLEFNTSTGRMSVLHDDLVTYVRNVVMLRDYGDPSNLLIRPVAGATPAARPGAPRNVRILN